MKRDRSDLAHKHDGAAVVTHDNIDNSDETLGFWLYLMTDCLVFASLFATYMVLRGNTAGGPSGESIFSLPYVFVETILLLTSSLMSGLALLAARQNRRQQVLVYLVLTGLLGAAFLGMELAEFSGLVADGHSWKQSAFLSSYFGLVGTHGLHIFIGLVWLIASMWYVFKRGLNGRLLQRLTLFTLFWHFLDIVWICIFTLVYLIGGIG